MGLRPFGGAGGGTGTGGSVAGAANFSGSGLLTGCSDCAKSFCSYIDIKAIPHYKANRFKNDNQLEISVNRPITSSTPRAINNPPEATSSACMCERKRL